MTLDKPESPHLPVVARSIDEKRLWILGYVALSSALGTLLGWFTGNRVVAGKFGFLTQHRWAYRLSVDDKLTTAWVLTSIQDDKRILLYRGFLHSFHLKRDGTFSYVVLEHVQRGYLELSAGSPRASMGGNWPAMGQSTREAEKHELAERPQRYNETLFAIEGEDIANIVFDRYRVGFSMQMESRELERTMDSALLTYGEIEARVRERMEHRRAHEPNRSRTEEGDTPQK